MPDQSHWLALKARASQVLFAGVIAMACLLAQTPTAKKSSAKKLPVIEQVRRTKPESQHVHSDTWEAGEIKSCATYSGQPFIVFCDYLKLSWDASLMKLVVANLREGKSKEEAYELAFIEAFSRSREFTVEFLNDLGRDPNPWPDPSIAIEDMSQPFDERIAKRAANPALRKMTGWHCTKDKVILCSLSGTAE